MQPESMDDVFHALASATRREILDIVKSRPGCAVVDVCRYFDVSRIAVMKHLNVLEAAGLVISDKAGRVRRLYFNAAPIQAIYERWTTEYSAGWAGRLTEFKRAVEASVGRDPGRPGRRKPSGKPADSEARAQDPAAEDTRCHRHPSRPRRA